MSDFAEMRRDLVDTIRIEIAFPNMKLSSNETKGLHYAVIAQRRSKARRDAFYEVRSQGIKKLDSDKINVRVTFHPPDKRRRNADNIISAFKSQQDGVADAIGIPDEHWSPSYHTGPIVPGGRTVLEISPTTQAKESE